MPVITVSPLSTAAAEPYDVLIAAVGFEQRARHASQKLHLKARTQCAIGFPDRHVCAYSDNRDWFIQNGFNYTEMSDREFSEFTRKQFPFTTPEGEKLRIAVDISSFNRTRLATIIECACEGRENLRSICLHFYYSLAAFSAPSEYHKCRNTHVGPVTPAFAGWSDDPMLPPYAVLGLGYEHGKALGAIDHLEVSNALAFIPVSPVPEYLTEVVKANSSLLSAVGMSHSVKYRVHEPTRTFEMLESAVNGLKTEFNPVLLPFGPKIFFVISLLVAKLHPQCSVWRVSAGEGEVAIDRLPSPYILSFEANLDFQSQT